MATNNYHGWGEAPAKKAINELNRKPSSSRNGIQDGPGQGANQVRQALHTSTVTPEGPARPHPETDLILHKNERILR